MDLSRYADLFLTESREHLSAMNHSLLALERAPAASEPVQSLFRAVHTVKGMSATMGYQAVAELAHEMESILDRVRRGSLEASPPVIEALFGAADALEAAIEASVRTDGEGADVSGAVSRLRACAPAAAATEAAPDETAASVAAAAAMVEPAALAAEEHAAEPAERSDLPGRGGRVVRVRIARAAPLRSARALVVLRQAEALGTVRAVSPPPAAIAAGEFGDEIQVRLESTATDAEIASRLGGMADVEEVLVASGEAAPAAGETARAGDAVPASAPGARAPRHVRIDLRRLDALMNLVGELVIARGRLVQLSTALDDPALDDAVAETGRLVAELQDQIMLSRMVPVGQVFDRFPRLVRDAAHALGKQVAFTVEGSDIELDRSMLDEIGEPVVHLLRNAVDHGVEPPAEREAAGKPPVGSLRLSVARERSTVLVRVSDDGRGVDRDKVLARARAMGLVTEDRTELGDDELARIIARPGFSTAERVSDLSGRGVGIDIVMNRVRALGGAVEIRSTPGQGTTVTVRLPHTLAIVRALLARVRDETYAVPLAHVNETVELEPRALRRVQGREMLVMREDVLPLIRFRDLVRLPATEESRSQVIVLEVGDRRAGLVVDELTGQQDIVVKQFDPARDALALFSGATILPDGAPALIVDVGSLL